MSVEHEVKMEEASSSSSYVVDYQMPDEKRFLSPDDVAWVEACLNVEYDISETNWDSMKHALLEALEAQPGLFYSPEPPSDERPKQTPVKRLTLRDQLEADQFLEMGETEEIPRSPSDVFHIEEDVESRGDNFPIEDVDDLGPLSFDGNPFLPNYIKDLKEMQSNAYESDLGSAVEMEPSIDDIFRVWDLNIPTEENELDKQLQKILEENDLPSKTSVAFANSGADDNTKGESFEDIINAVSNISLN